jgi:putative transposase
MLRLVLVLFCTLRSGLHSRADLALENLALRQQLSVFACSGQRPRMATADRWFWIAR